ncbi:MAG: flagellar filament capping protein FliD [Pirellulales bacterium]|nr:flagellar filament capping protein FliD [Pirellulales bacterium]
MAQIQSNIGIITGMAIGDTVDALIALAAKPRDMLSERTQTLAEEQIAVTELSAYLYSVKLISDNLGKKDLFDAREATSSNENVIAASVSGQPPEGVYHFTSVRAVQNHQFLSGGVTSDSEPLGGGTMSFRFGENIERSVSLDNFGGGAGVRRGQIRITDRSGASAQIDLSTVQTVDDVLDAINSNININVTAVAHADGFRLIDNTGQSVSNLMVQEVSGGTTAASLGLDGINEAGPIADSRDMIWLSRDMRLEDLNDGTGVGIDDVYPADFSFELRDGTTGTIDFSPRTGGDVDKDLTLGDLIDRINAAAPDKLRAEIAPDGDRLIITDLTDNLLAASLDKSSEAGNDGTGTIDQTGSLGFLSGGTEADAATLSLQLTGNNNDLMINAGRNGDDLNGIEVVLVDNAGQGDVATADYDAVNKTLTIGINRGQTTANTVSAAIDEQFGFSLSSSYGSEALRDLGLADNSGTVEADEGAIVGRRILGGTRSVLLSTLNGGRGYDQLGTLELTDRSGNSDTVDLSDAETLDEVIETINAADVAILARVNHAKNGIELIDQTGMNASNLIVANGDGETDTAGKLGIAIDAAVDSVNSGDMHMQVINENTKLADYNGGQGVASGNFTIFSSAGKYGKINLTDGQIETVGDLMKAIDRLGIRVSAEINDTGDGILIRDLDNAGTQMRVVEGNSTTAADLHLLGGVSEIERNGRTYKVIDGSTTQTIELGEDDTLDDLRTKINGLSAGINASIFDDGSNHPYRLSVNSDRMGRQGQLVIDTSGLGLQLEETAEARDALMVYGSPNNVANGILVSSSSNKFTDVLPGLNLEIKDTSNKAVMIDISRSDKNALANMEALVENYNRFRESLSEYTSFNEETLETGLLFGDSAALRLDVDLSTMLSGRFLGVGSIQSLAEVGLDIKKDGTLSFDAAKFSTQFEKDPDAVARFFTGNKSSETGSDYGINVKQEKTSLRTAYTDSVMKVTVDHDLLNQRYDKEPEVVISYLRSLTHGGTFDEFGISIEDGQVQIDETIFQAKYLSDSIFADKLTPQTTGGVSNMFDEVIEKLSGEDVSLMARRFITLGTKIDQNEAKLERMNKQLELEQDRLYMEFYNMEIAIGKMQNNLYALDAIYPMQNTTAAESN